MTCPTKELLDYLLKPEKYAKTPESPLQHALVCASCKRVLNNPKIQEAFINALTCEETPGDKIRKAKKRTEISETKPGQLWKIKIPKANENILAITTSSIIKEADGLYLKIVVREENISQERENQSVCAIDMGINFFLTTSDGEFVENPKHLFNYLKELRVENRKLSRMKKGGNNWKKQVKVLQLLHQKISRVRKDFLHKQSRGLANNYSTVIREDLNISKMVKDSKLAKHILDCSWGLFFELLEYKTNVVKVNPAYSSQTCSKCKHTSKENRKTQSLFECINCGYTENADFNASKVLLKTGLA